MKVGKAQEEIKFFSKVELIFFSYLLCRFILAVVAGLGVVVVVLGGWWWLVDLAFWW